MSFLFRNLSTHDLTQRSTKDGMVFKGLNTLSTHDLTQRSTQPDHRKQYRTVLSTHDLTQRSTILIPVPPDFLKSFNSRPHAEVDGYPKRTPCISLYFQLTTSRRGRLQGAYFPAPHGALSTHDLTQRSTGTDTRIKILLYPFNSRPHAEVDVWNDIRSSPPLSFNSRPHAEVDISRSAY